jgi:hypothetical protein
MMLPNPSPLRPAPRPREIPPESLSYRATQTIRLAQENLRRLQAEDGHWPGDYGGPMFLLPMLVALYYATGTLDRVPAERREGMVTYFSNVLHADGSIGLHAEDPRGMLFTTVLGYVAHQGPRRPGRRRAVGQVDALPSRPVRLAGGPSRPPRAVAPAEITPVSPRSTLVPLPPSLPARRLALWNEGAHPGGRAGRGSPRRAL